MPTEYVVKFKKFEPTDPRLGRHVRHDSRSLQYQVEAAPRETLVSKRHTSNIPTLDQGNLGSCTGNASTKNISYEPFWSDSTAVTGGAEAMVRPSSVLSTTDANVDEQYAVGVYSAATALDSYQGTYPPTDTGSDGLSVAKVLKSRGLISGYQHATSLDAVLTALQKSAVIVGTEWRQDMFNPDSDGRIRITGAVAGGHEYVLDEVDMENQRVWMQNSWSNSWGVNGRGYFTFADFQALLAAQGDCTIFVPNTEPAPTPTPPQPQPTPTPTPTPAPVDDADQELATAAHKWLNGFPFFYKSIQRALKTWLDKKGL